MTAFDLVQSCDGSNATEFEYNSLAGALRRVLKLAHVLYLEMCLVEIPYKYIQYISLLA